MNKPQYGEEAIILEYFAGRGPGLVVDVGAADGQRYSNSYFLIADHQWQGVLIEPEPAQFRKLQRLHAGNPNVHTLQAAAGPINGTLQLWPSEMASTAVPSWKELVARVAPHVKYGAPVTVREATLPTLLAEARCPDKIDFLSIDCEGMDIEVLKSMDFTRYNVELICVESGDDGSTLAEPNIFLRSLGYRFHARTAGNTLWKK